MRFKLLVFKAEIVVEYKTTATPSLKSASPSIIDINAFETFSS